MVVLTRLWGASNLLTMSSVISLTSRSSRTVRGSCGRRAGPARLPYLAHVCSAWLRIRPHRRWSCLGGRPLCPETKLQAVTQIYSVGWLLRLSSLSGACPSNSSLWRDLRVSVHGFADARALIMSSSLSMDALAAMAVGVPPRCWPLGYAISPGMKGRGAGAWNIETVISPSRQQPGWSGYVPILK
jgi:hypothetical protein